MEKKEKHVVPIERQDCGVQPYGLSHGTSHEPEHRTDAGSRHYRLLKGSGNEKAKKLKMYLGHISPIDKTIVH